MKQNVVDFYQSIIKQEKRQIFFEATPVVLLILGSKSSLWGEMDAFTYSTADGYRVTNSRDRKDGKRLCFACFLCLSKQVLIRNILGFSATNFHS